MEKTSKLLPNTTQIPNIILDDWLPRLNDVEFRILMVITRQTLGWVMDDESGRRKERDWLSMAQLAHKTGRGRTQISSNLKSLIENHQLIEATDKEGGLLDTAEKRKSNRGQIFYRLTLRDPQASLFDSPRVRKPNTQEARVRKPDTTIPNTTKETHITKDNLVNEESFTPVDNVGKKEEKVLKPPSDHKLFIDFFYQATKATRNVATIITAADAKMLKQALDRGIKRETLEQVAIFFLTDKDFTKFSPTIRTLLSGGIITGLINRMQNEPEFWKKLDGYSERRGIQTALAGDPKKIAESASRFLELKKALTASLSMPRST